MAQSQACCQPGEAAGGSSPSVAVLTDNPSQCPKVLTYRTVFLHLVDAEWKDVCNPEYRRKYSVTT